MKNKAAQSYAAFQKRASSKADAYFREIVRGARLSRGEISRKCGFGRSALTQNLRIEGSLFCLQEALIGDAGIAKGAIAGRRHVTLEALLSKQAEVQGPPGNTACS